MVTQTTDYVGWRCIRCDAPVAGTYTKCENCGHKPERSLNSINNDLIIKSDFIFHNAEGKETRLSDASRKELITLIYKLIEGGCM